MKAETYIIKAKATENRKFKEVAARLTKPANIRMLHAAIGMITETSEIILALKSKKLNRVNLMEEAGDILWYVAIAIDTLKLPAKKILGQNQKLKKIESDAALKKQVIERLISMVEAMGDIQDLLKKNLFYGREVKKAQHEEKLMEIGRLAAEVSELTGFKLSQSMARNIKKLEARFKNSKGKKKASFSNTNANVRNLKVEEKILSGKKVSKTSKKKTA